MQLDAYQQAARSTAIYEDRHKVIYPALGLASEAGEVAGKGKKALRGHGGSFTPAQIAALRDELGEVLWYVAVLAADLDLSLDAIAQANVPKLASRQERGALGGEGDRR